ncbi:MAG TPA: amidohydrolase family protein [bacterium]|nr:amidohydrolase family protein [bacterium]
MGGLLIENGLLIDGTGGTPREGGWVLTEGVAIKAVGAGAPPRAVGADVRRIDARGGSILPGLINLHVHIHRRHLHRPVSKTAFRAGAASVESLPDAVRILWALRNLWWEMQEGVTTFRDISSKNRINLTIKRAIQTEIFKGPRMICCGQGVGMTGGHGTHGGSGTAEADGPDEVRKAVRAELKAGADFIKVMASAGLSAMPDEDPRMVEFGVDELRAACEEAHARHRAVAAHAYPAQAIKNCLAAGVDCIEHGSIMDDETIAMMVEKRANYVPTMTGMYNFWQREVSYGRKDVADTIRAVILEPHRVAVAKCHERGVRIGTGTDTLGQLNQEIEMLHDCGLPTMACIRAATAVGAEILGLEREIGTLEAGKRADVLVVDGNPVADLAALRSVRAVVHDGWAVDGKALAEFGDA